MFDSSRSSVLKTIDLTGTDLLWVKIIITLGPNLIDITKTDNGVMTMQLEILQVINTLPLQGTTDKIKHLIPGLTERIIKVTLITLQDIPLSIIQQMICLLVICLHILETQSFSETGY